MLSCRIRFQFNIHSGPHLWKINIPCRSGAMAQPPHSPDRGDDRQAGPQVQHRRRAAGTPILHSLTHHHHLTQTLTWLTWSPERCLLGSCWLLKVTPWSPDKCLEGPCIPGEVSCLSRVLILTADTPGDRERVRYELLHHNLQF